MPEGLFLFSFVLVGEESVSFFKTKQKVESLKTFFFQIRVCLPEGCVLSVTDGSHVWSTSPGVSQYSCKAALLSKPRSQHQAIDCLCDGGQGNTVQQTAGSPVQSVLSGHKD